MHRSGIALAALGLTATGAAVAATGGSAAAGCAARVTVSHPSGSGLVLSPATAKVTLGECVQFTNSTRATVTIAISGKPSYTVKVPAASTTTAAGGYHPSATGTDTVDASETVLLAVKVTGTGQVEVSPQPSASPIPSASTKHGSAPSPGKNPDVAPKPKRHAGHRHHAPKPHATGIKLPPLPPLPTAGVTAAPRGANPLVAPGPRSVVPSVTETSSPVAAVVSGPIERATDDTRGLPEAIAVLVVLGALSGWGRVLLANAGPGSPSRPVDGGRRGRHRT